MFKNLLNQFNLRKTSGSTERILSVDALRGFDMFWIVGGEMIFKSLDKIFQNSTTAWISLQLDHVEWLGFRFYDIIMPLFLFIVGVAMPLSFSKRLAAGDSKFRIMSHVVKRVIILWVLGMMVQGHLLSYSFEKIDLYSNTLQAIAAGYFISSIIILYAKAVGQIAITCSLMILYWLVMAFLPIPGTSGAYLPENNPALHIDKLLLGTFQDGTTYTWILSSLNFGATTMLGVFAGYVLRSDHTKYRKTGYLMVFAVACYLLAILWHPVHPIIKHIWTGSFVLYAGSFSLALLALFYLVIDVWNLKAWSRFFIIIGANAIVAYVASHLFDFRHVSDIFIRGLEQYVGSWYDFMRYIGGFLVLFGLLWYMHTKKIFVKV